MTENKQVQAKTPESKQAPAKAPKKKFYPEDYSFRPHLGKEVAISLLPEGVIKGTLKGVYKYEYIIEKDGESIIIHKHAVRYIKPKK